MEEEKHSPKQRHQVASKQKVELQRENFNVSSRTLNVTDTKIISTILQGITGQQSEFESSQGEAEVKLTPYQQQMVEWQIQRDKTTGGASTIQEKIDELQAKKKGPRARKKSILVEFREEDSKHVETVGLDDALLELRIQEDYLSKKLIRNGSPSRMDTEYGLGAILSSNSSSGRRVSIRDGKQLISMAYGIQADGTALDRESIGDQSSSSFGNLSQAFNASMSQLILKDGKDQHLIAEEETEENEESSGSTSEVDSDKGTSAIRVKEEFKAEGTNSDGAELSNNTQRNIRTKQIIIEQSTTQRLVTENNNQEEKIIDHVIDHNKDGSASGKTETKSNISGNPPRPKSKFTKSSSLLVPQMRGFGSGAGRPSFALLKDNEQGYEGAGAMMAQLSLPATLPNSGDSKRRRVKLIKANTLEDFHSEMQNMADEEDASSKIIREAREKEKGQFNLRQILKYFSILKRDRTKEQTAVLIKYLKSIKVFIDIVLRGAREKGTLAAMEEADITFEHLAASIRVQKLEAGNVLFEEGTDGELFYIIMQGRCECLKASPITIHSMTHSEAIEDRTPHYFHAFMDNYEEIFWSGMDITRQEVDDMLGILRDDGASGSGQIMQIPEWPISKKKQLILQGYIRRHEKNSNYRNHKHEPIMLVNKHLVYLQTGAGFGELSLLANMSESEADAMKKRMATVRTTTDCYLATLTADNFMSVLKRAKKRQMASQVSFLKRFVLFKNLSQMKLQKLFYLLKECPQPKGSELFRQRETNIDGVYLIKEGEVAYDFKHEVVQPDYSKNVSWSNPSVLQNNLDKKILRKEIALFTNNEIVGFEEILRKRLLAILKQEFIEGEGNDYFKNQSEKTDQLFNDSTLDYRNFTAVVKSSSAKLYFLKRADLESFLRFMPNVMVRDEVQKRVQFLSRQINTIMKVTKDEFDERQKIALAKQLITRRVRYSDLLQAPATEREELVEKVQESLAKDRCQSPSISLRTSSGLHTMEASIMQKKLSQAHDSLEHPSIQSISPRFKQAQVKKLNSSVDLAQEKSGVGQQNMGPKAARFRSSVWSVSHQSNQNLHHKESNRNQNDSGSYNLQGETRIGSLENSARRGEITPTDSQLMQDSVMSVDQKNRQSSRLAQPDNQLRQLTQPTRREIDNKHYSVDTQSLDYQKHQQQTFGAVKTNIHSISVEQLRCKRDNGNFLPTLSTERPMFDDPYASSTRRQSEYPRLSNLKRQSKLNTGASRLHKMGRHRTQNSNPSKSPESNSQAQRVGVAHTFQQGKQQLIDSSSLPNLRTMIDTKRDIGAKIKIEEDDVGVIEAEDFVQKNFVKNAHVQDSENNLSLAGFSKAPITEKKQIQRIRAAEHNSIQRKYDAFQSQLSQMNPTSIVGRNVQKLQNSARSVPISEIGTSATRRDGRASMTSAMWNKSDRRKQESMLKDSMISQRSTQLPLSQDERVINQAEIDKAIQDEKTDFDSRMLEVLDGIAPLLFDHSQNRKQIEAMQDRMSETCEIMASRQAHSYRKSDDALLDKNSLGPVYCKILQKRRRKGSPYKKEILPSGKSVQTNFPEPSEIDQSSNDASYAKKKMMKGLNTDLSLASLGRYSSMRSIRQEKDYSVVDNSFLIKSMNSGNQQKPMTNNVDSETVPHRELATSLDRSRQKAKVEQEKTKRDDEKAGFLQPRLQPRMQSVDSQSQLMVKKRSKNATNQKLRDKLMKNKRQSTQQQRQQNKRSTSRLVITLADNCRVQENEAAGEASTLSVIGIQNNGNVSEDLYSSMSALASIENNPAQVVVTERLSQQPFN